jgi:hypothetical protein
LFLTRSSALAEAFLIFAKIGGELVTERMFMDMRHRFRVLKLTELVCPADKLSVQAKYRALRAIC